MTKRKILRKPIPNTYVPFGLCSVEGEIGKVIKTLTKVKEKAEKQGYKNVEILIDSGHENAWADLYGDIPETDAEMERREKVWMKKEERERVLYEKLKKKFEKKVPANMKIPKGKIDTSHPDYMEHDEYRKKKRKEEGN